MESLERLERWFEKCPGAIVAFSGGVDSSLVAFLARHLLGKPQALAVISASPSLKLSDLDEAKRFARSHDLALRVIATEEMSNPDYFNNPSNRCYFCKHTLYDELSALRAEFPDWWVLNGTNVDDHSDYRPGLKAAREFQIRAPLAECSIDKAEVRKLAARFKLECWDKPASPCLSSRVPYGDRITVEKLRQIEAAEAVLVRMGFEVNRVRHLGETARIEVPLEKSQELRASADRLREQIVELGFTGMEIDEEGFVSGKLNRAIP